jgi:hypothetical protein
MAKIQRTLLLAASLLVWLTPALANDAKQSDSAPASANTAGASSSSSASPSKIDHPHYPHDWIPSKHEIMGLSGLSDKQKNDIQAIYDATGPRFAALDLEYHDLRKQNWEKIQDVLTPDQVNEVQTRTHNKNHPNQPLQESGSKPQPNKDGAQSR